MFMQVPAELAALAPIVSPAALPPPKRRADPPPPEYRPSDPGRQARMFPAIPPKAPKPPHANEARASTAPAWWEDPVAVGSLLIVLPPVGLAAVWSSRRYSADARWALTVMTALTMCLVTAVVIAIAALR